jgi:hypothetical protein
MTSDMAELEFALNAFIAEKGQKRGDGNLHKIEEYRALRSMRSVAFTTLGNPALIYFMQAVIISGE